MEKRMFQLRTRGVNKPKNTVDFINGCSLRKCTAVVSERCFSAALFIKSCVARRWRVGGESARTSPR